MAPPNNQEQEPGSQAPEGVKPEASLPIGKTIASRRPLPPTGRGDRQSKRVTQGLRRQFEGIRDPVTTALVGANFVGGVHGNPGGAVSTHQAPYNALKSALQQRFHAKSELMKALEQLEAKPNSPGRRATLREEVVLEKADYDADLQTLAYELLATLPRQAWEDLPGGYLEPDNPEGRADWAASYPGLQIHVKGNFTSTYLTIISIIQGVALSYLAASTDVVGDLVGGRLTYPRGMMIVTTLVILIATWHEYAINAITFTWIPSLIDSCVPFLLGGLEVLVIRSINLDVKTWLLMVAIFYGGGILAYLNLFIRVNMSEPDNRYPLHALGKNWKVNQFWIGGIFICQVALWYAAMNGEHDAQVQAQTVSGAFILLAFLLFQSILYWRAMTGRPKASSKPGSTKST